MGKNAVNIDARKAKAIALLSSGMSAAKVAEEIGVTTRTLERWQLQPAFAELRNDVSAKYLGSIPSTPAAQAHRHLCSGYKRLQVKGEKV